MAHGNNGNRDSLLNVRASFIGDIGPAGPIAAPPAPPPGTFLPGHKATRKEVSDMAKTRMKQLQWDKLTAQHAAETIWGQSGVEDEELAKVLRSEGLFEEMEEDFKAKQAAKRQTSAAAKKDKFEFKTHLSFQTRQGIEMVLKRVRSKLTDSKHATPEEVAHHIVNCDQVVLDQSFLTELLRHYPESETKGQLGEYRNATDEELRLLHPSDRLVVLLMTVPHLKEKVKGLLFRTKYKEAFELVKEGSGKIRAGSEGLVKAQNFAKLLGIILMMGNYLNATGVQGGAFGFKISSINKLVDTKASDGTTLLHFVERTVSKAFPEVEAFLDELEDPAEACRVQLLDLKRDLAELKSGSLQHKKELDRFIDEDEAHLEDPYTKLMLPFLNEAGSELSRLGDQVQFTERTYIDALRYFGEGPDPKRRGFPAAQPMHTEDFFGVFREFSTAYRKVKADNVKIAEQRQIESKRRAAAEEREKERLEALARKEAGVDDSLVLETLLGNLRTGGGTPKSKRKARERGAARRAQQSLGVGMPGAQPSVDGREGAPGTSNDQAEGDATGLGITNASGGAGVATPASDNPSELAQAMLAKLQGGAGGSAATLPSDASNVREKYARRRERRATETATRRRSGMLLSNEANSGGESTGGGKTITTSTSDGNGRTSQTLAASPDPQDEVLPDEEDDTAVVQAEAHETPRVKTRRSTSPSSPTTTRSQPGAEHALGTAQHQSHDEGGNGDEQGSASASASEYGDVDDGEEPTFQMMSSDTQEAGQGQDQGQGGGGAGGEKESQSGGSYDVDDFYGSGSPGMEWIDPDSSGFGRQTDRDD